MWTNNVNGALSGRLIKDMLDAGCISGADEKNIRPSSLDLSLSDEIYKVEGVFQPRHKESVRDVLSLIKKKKHDLSKPLEKGVMYIARLNEKFSLPGPVYGFCNPKSTTGRLDLHVRTIADGVSRYDSLTPAGWSGELWVSIVSKTFHIKIDKNQLLNQARFFNADTKLSDLEIELFHAKRPLLWKPEGKKIPWRDIKISDKDNSLILTLDCEGANIGWRARSSSRELDMNSFGGYRASDFFSPLKKKNDFVYLRKNEFYILSTFESVRVPPQLACEMVPMDEKSGEFRAHYAGFIDPGWGWGKKGEGKGKPLTLELSPFEDLVVRPFQPIAKVRFERIVGGGEQSYDGIDSSYLKQSGPRLAKQFKT